MPSSLKGPFWRQADNHRRSHGQAALRPFMPKECQRSSSSPSLPTIRQFSYECARRSRSCQGILRNFSSNSINKEDPRSTSEDGQKKWFENPANKSTNIEDLIKFLKQNVAEVERFSRLQQLGDAEKPVKPEAQLFTPVYVQCSLTSHLDMHNK